MRASGTFDVRFVALESSAGEDGVPARRGIEKTFRGELEASSRGEMLSAVSSVQGSAGYVAIELVRGTLAGREGTFVLQHSGLMARGQPSLTVSVVPDSGSGGLVGLTGSMQIVVADGKHSYVFDYALPDAG